MSFEYLQKEIKSVDDIVSLFTLCDEVNRLKEENKVLKNQILDLNDKVNIMNDYMCINDNEKLRSEIKFIYEYLAIKAEPK